MIATKMGVIIVIIMLVLLIILVLKMTKKYHIMWYWCQDIWDSYMVEEGQKIWARPSLHPFGQCPQENVFFPVRCSLIFLDYIGLGPAPLFLRRKKSWSINRKSATKTLHLGTFQKFIQFCRTSLPFANDPMFKTTSIRCFPYWA